MKPLSIISSLLFFTFLTYAYIPTEDIIHNPKAIEWHTQQHAYFTKIQIAKSAPKLTSKRKIV